MISTLDIGVGWLEVKISADKEISQTIRLEGYIYHSSTNAFPPLVCEFDRLGDDQLDALTKVGVILWGGAAGSAYTVLYRMLTTRGLSRG